MTTSRLAARLGLCFGLQLCTACVGAPDDTVALGAGATVEQHSEGGLVDATVALGGATLSRGLNDLVVTLHAEDGSHASLNSVVATMVAHGHHALPPLIVAQGEAFRVEGLDLFMSGRWNIALGVELDSQSDSVEFALDVP